VSVAEETGSTTAGMTLPLPAGRRRLIFAIVSIGLFMASIDQTNVMVSQLVSAVQGLATGS
jgi:hypothetical protein